MSQNKRKYVKTTKAYKFVKAWHQWETLRRRCDELVNSPKMFTEEDCKKFVEDVKEWEASQGPKLLASYFKKRGMEPYIPIGQIT